MQTSSYLHFSEFHNLKLHKHKSNIEHSIMVKWDYLCACVCACVLSWPFKHIIPSLEFSIAVLKKFPRLLRNDWMEFLKQLFSFSFPFFFCCCDCKKAAGLHSFSMLAFHLPLYSFMPCSCITCAQLVSLSLFFFLWFFFLFIFLFYISFCYYGNCSESEPL